MTLATFGGGCLWCTEAVFAGLRGVVEVWPGYMGGHDPAPTYERVCRGETGHAEVVQIGFDPAQVDYATLLAVFFATHDPTTLNRQGHDVGTQYRSVVFYHDAAQEAEAAAMICRLNDEGGWPGPVVTALAPAAAFHVSEKYHHRYFERNPYQGYCQAVVAPKLARLRQGFASLLAQPD